MKISYKQIKENIKHNCSISLETAIKYYDGEIDTQFLNKIAKTTVEGFQEFYEIDMRKSVMVGDMKHYLKDCLRMHETRELMKNERSNRKYNKDIRSLRIH